MRRDASQGARGLRVYSVLTVGSTMSVVRAALQAQVLLTPLLENVAAHSSVLVGAVQPAALALGALRAFRSAFGGQCLDDLLAHGVAHALESEDCIVRGRRLRLVKGVRGVDVDSGTVFQPEVDRVIVRARAHLLQRQSLVREHHCRESRPLAPSQDHTLEHHSHGHVIH
eukprot:1569502-Rhodomonas_salina.1